MPASSGVRSALRALQGSHAVTMFAHSVRPPRARREKPRVSAFLSAHTERIVALEPDLVLAFSDLQADIAAQLGWYDQSHLTRECTRLAGRTPAALLAQRG